MKTFILIIFACFMISCNENGPVNNGSDKTSIDKSVTPSSSEQIFESTDGIRVIIPGGALNNDLGIKLVKLANPPKLNDSKIILGTNIFQLSLNGDLNFNTTIQFRVKYDKSKIQTGFTPLTGVKGIAYFDNLWSESEYEIDVTNEEIVFFVEPTGGKSFKDKEILLDNAGVTLGDGYSINDAGQDDEFLVKIQKSFNISIDFSGYHVGINNGEFSRIHIPAYFDMGSETFIDPLVWNGNAFSVTNSETSITGTVDSKNKTISLTAITNESKLNETLVKISCELNLQNVPYDYDSMIFGHTFRVDGGGQEVQGLVKSILYTKTIYDKDIQDKIIEQTEYTGTDFSKNAWVEIEMMHK